jgi:hypothetical protein
MIKFRQAVGVSENGITLKEVLYISYFSFLQSLSKDSSGWGKGECEITRERLKCVTAMSRKSSRAGL